MSPVVGRSVFSSDPSPSRLLWLSVLRRLGQLPLRHLRPAEPCPLLSMLGVVVVTGRVGAIDVLVESREQLYRCMTRRADVWSSQ